MKKLLSLAAAVVCITLAFAGCSTSTGYENKLTGLDGEVSSNGGFVVEKGDYVYFVNGVASNTDDNSYGDVVTGALVRMKKTDLAATANAKTELVVPALFVAGDFTSGFYIFGNEVFYASPTTAKDKEGNVENTKLDFVKTSLDGKNSVTLKTVDDKATVYRYVQKDNVVYLVMKTVNSDKETVINVYNATENKEVYTTEKIADCLFSDDQASGEIYYTRVAHDDDLDKDMSYNELHRVVFGGADELVMSGAGKMTDSSGVGISGVTYTLIKDTTDSLYYKAVYVDTTISTSTQYYMVKKSELKANDSAANIAKAVMLNAGTTEAATVFVATSIYLSKNCIVYLDTTYGIIKYDYQNNDAGSSFNRTKLFYDSDLIGYTYKFYQDGYMYFTDSSSYYYRVNLGSLLDMSTFATKSEADRAACTVDKVNYLANSTAWYTPEVIGDYFLSVYTADPYYSLVYCSDMSKTKDYTDEQIEAIHTADRENILANAATRISLLSDAMQEKFDKYMDDNYPDTSSSS